MTLLPLEVRTAVSDSLERLHTLRCLLDTRDCLDHNARSTMSLLLQEAEGKPAVLRTLEALLEPESILADEHRVALGDMVEAIRVTLHQALYRAITPPETE